MGVALTSMSTSNTQMSIYLSITGKYLFESLFVFSLTATYMKGLRKKLKGES